MKYSKQPLEPAEHVELLRERGLIIQDETRAKKYLENVGYFRLTGYMFHLQKRDGSHMFVDNVSFNDIILHYQFDKKLRSLFLDYIERIEVALRARLSNAFSIRHGFYWYTEYELYLDKHVYHGINQEIKEYFVDPQERYLKSFKFKYNSENIPPSNMAMEILTLGKLSRLFKAVVNDEEKTAISLAFGIPSTMLASWLIRLTIVRNICAHHARLWNRKLSAAQPVIPTRKKNKFNGELPQDFRTSVYGIIAMTDRLLKKINPTHSFITKVIDLIDEYPTINTSLMGFPDNWREEPAW
ncbi:MAG: abortive infection bacteriophage resistance protein [Flavobacteriales bacterium]|jgi:abortive infection bacteriophage resistance protein